MTSSATTIVNVTWPVGMPVPVVGATIAVNVTASPRVEGLGDDESIVVVAIVATVCVSGVAVLVAKVVLPA